jgi:hypothetical protein
VSPVLAALLASIVSVVGGYYLGVVRSRNERRDNAIADIYKALMRFYRSLISWSEYPTGGPRQPPGAAPTTWLDHCMGLLDEFAEAHYGNSIWIGRATDELITDFAVKGWKVLTRFAHMDDRGRLPDGTNAKEHMHAELTPLRNEIADRLRDEMESSLYLIPYRVVIKNRSTPRT